MKQKPMKLTPLYEYQKEGVNQIERFGGRALLADDMGLGKTIQALTWMRRNPEARPVIVVCPAVVKYNWEAEAQKHIGMRCEVLESRRSQNWGFIKPQLAIINYDILKNWLKVLKRLKPKLIIIDESHYIKSPTTQRTRAVRELCKGVPHIICLSGTPLMNNPAELFTTLKLLKPSQFPSRVKYVTRYCKMKEKFGRMVYVGPRNLKSLHRRLKKHLLIRRLTKDVLHELPPSRIVTVPLQLTDPKQYRHATNDFLGWLKQYGSLAKAIRAARAESFLKVTYLKRLAAELKLPNVMQWLDEFLEETDEKLIVFGWHKKILRPIRDKYDCIFIDGEVSSKKRHLAIQHFNSKKGPQLAVCNIQSGGVGTNMTGACKTATIELSWTPADHQQAMKRAHRIGQTKPVNHYYLIARNTIETPICALLEKNLATLGEALDGNALEHSLFEELIKKGWK